MLAFDLSSDRGECSPLVNSYLVGYLGDILGLQRHKKMGVAQMQVLAWHFHKIRSEASATHVGV